MRRGQPMPEAGKRRLSKARKSRKWKWSAEQRAKIMLARKPWTEERRQRVSKKVKEAYKNPKLLALHRRNAKRLWASPQYKKKQRKAHLVAVRTPAFRARAKALGVLAAARPYPESAKRIISEKQKKSWTKARRKAHAERTKLGWVERRVLVEQGFAKARASGDLHAKISASSKRALADPKKRAAVAKRVRLAWRDPEVRDRMVRASLKAVNLKPNKLESLVGGVLGGLFPGEYAYVGDGSVVIGGKCPDFINVNGQKKIVEVFGDFWHRGEVEAPRRRHFRKFGFKTLIVWEHQCKDSLLLEKMLKRFHQS